MDDRHPNRGALAGHLIIAAVRNRCGVSSDKRKKRADIRGRTFPPDRVSSLLLPVPSIFVAPLRKSIETYTFTSVPHVSARRARI